jgi:hypothetical protein
VRCEPLRASKDGRTHCAEHHPSRRAEDGAHLRMTVVSLQDDRALAATAPVITTIKISSCKSTLRHVCHAESPAQEAIARR